MTSLFDFFRYAPLRNARHFDCKPLRHASSFPPLPTHPCWIPFLRSTIPRESLFTIQRSFLRSSHSHHLRLYPPPQFTTRCEFGKFSNCSLGYRKNRKIGQEAVRTKARSGSYESNRLSRQ